MSDAEKLATLKAALEAAGPARTVERVDALNALAWEIGFADVDRTAALGEEAVAIARELSYPRGLAWGLLNVAYRDYFVADYQEALGRANESRPIFEELGDHYGLANLLTGFGLIYWSLGDFEKAVEALYEGIALFRELDDPEQEAWSLTSLGGVYESVGDLDKSAECHEAARERFRAVGDRLGESRALTGLGATLQKRGELGEALAHHEKALAIARELENPMAQSRALNDIGTIHAARDELDEAQAYLDQALALRIQTGQRPAQVTTLLDLGQLALEKKDHERAIEQLESARRLATELGTKPKLFRAHELLSLAYERVGDFERALHHHRAFERTKSEVLGEESATRLRNLQIKFESDALESLKQAQAQIVESEKMAVLGRLIAGIAHELNTPAGVLRSSADTSRRAIQVLRGLDLDLELGREAERHDAAAATLEQNVQTVHDVSTRLAKIVDNLKRFIQLDQAELQLADIRSGIDAMLELLAPQWGERIRVVKEYEEIPRVEVYAAELNQALMTLLTNAGEAIDGEGRITVRATRDNGNVRILTSDTGRGMPRDRVESLFDIGFSRKGSNIRLHTGLAHVKATVHKHRGEITVESEPDRGTTFEIALPLRQG